MKVRNIAPTHTAVVTTLARSYGTKVQWKVIREQHERVRVTPKVIQCVTGTQMRFRREDGRPVRKRYFTSSYDHRLDVHTLTPIPTPTAPQSPGRTARSRRP